MTITGNEIENGPSFLALYMLSDYIKEYLYKNITLCLKSFARTVGGQADVL